MRRLRWLTAMLLAFAMLAAACGSDSSDDAAAPAEEPAETPTMTADEMAAMDDEEPAMTEEEMAAMDDEEPAMTEEEMAAMDDEEPMDEMMEIVSGVGVDAENMIIRVGLNADLTGRFSPLTTKIVDGQLAFWEDVNANGGIEGWTIEPIVIDTGYDVPTHLENWDIFSGDGDESVVMLTNSTGSPHTAAIAEDAVAKDMAVIPLSWYSGWGDPAFGANIFEVQTNYCVEAINAVTYLSETYGNKMAIATFPGEYGEDGARGAKIAAEALGLEIVYDGQGAVIPDADQTPVTTGIATSGADFTWINLDTTNSAAIIGGAAAAGYTGQWAGASPSYNPALLGTPLADLYDSSYTHSTYTALWGTNDSEGMQHMVATMEALRPDAPFDDVYIISWIEGLIAQQTIEHAIHAGDITRAGILAAIQDIDVDLKGLAPDQSWSGDANDNVVRESYLYNITAADYTPGATVTTPGASNGFSLIEGPYSSPTAEAWVYETCFKPS